MKSLFKTLMIAALSFFVVVLGLRTAEDYVKVTVSSKTWDESVQDVLDLTN